MYVLRNFFLGNTPCLHTIRLILLTQNKPIVFRAGLFDFLFFLVQKITYSKCLNTNLIQSHLSIITCASPPTVLQQPELQPLNQPGRLPAQPSAQLWSDSGAGSDVHRGIHSRTRSRNCSHYYSGKYLYCKTYLFFLSSLCFVVKQTASFAARRRRLPCRSSPVLPPAGRSRR